MAVKGILFRLQLAGRGVVNFDSNEQRFIFNALSRKGGEKSFHENVQFAKHRWYADGEEDGQVKGRKKVTISADCLRHNIFIDDFLYQSPSVLGDRAILNRLLASEASLLRGYFFASPVTLKKKSAFAITDAEQTSDAISTLETFSKSGHRESKVDDDDTSDATFFKREVVGQIAYEARGYVDLRELQFISMHELYDRMAVISDDLPLYRPALEKAIGKTQDPTYYAIKDSAVCLPEYGMLLSAEQIKKLVRALFARMLRVYITKSAGAFAQVTGLQIKLVEDPFRDSMESQDGWVTIDSDAAIPDYEPAVFYERFDGEPEAVLKAMKDEAEEIKRITKDKKAAKKGNGNGKKGKGGDDENASD